MAGGKENDIAIIGMSCRVAGANSPSEFWDVLASSRDVQSKITRFSTEGFYHPDGGPRKGLTNVNKAYMLDDNLIDKFDNAFFYVTPLEAIAIDPQQRMLLELAFEATESAGIPLDKFAGSDTAVFAGMEGSEYHSIIARDLDATPRYLATGTPICMAANRISYFFDLSGPSMSVDTACSSAMAALHQAVRTLQHGDSKMAIVCAAKLILSPDMFIPSSELGFLSPTGKCHTFDAGADGYGRGEGVIAFLLKPLKEAIADHDPIRAIIKGTRLNQDGKTQGITLPSTDAQKRNMQALYEELGMPPASISYLEAHGTGTAAGDPIEFSAIKSVYEQSRRAVDPLIVGSVKSNIGHLEACSALGSVMKVALCLEKGQIPPQMNFRVPNPKIDFKNFKIPVQLIPWPTSTDGIRRAAVNTFGAGGTNGHAVLEAYPRGRPHLPPLEKRPYLFKISAADVVSLRQASLRFAEYVEASKPVLRDLAHTMLARRSTFRKSAFFTESSHEGIVKALRVDNFNVHTKPNENQKGLIFLFTGQGAQWAQMGKSLIEHSPLFRSVLRECDRVLSELPGPPAWNVIDELSRTQEASNIYKAEFSQPLCTAFQLGLVALLESWGVVPDAVVGHSSGEICAAYTAGILSLRDAMAVSYYRGLVLGRHSSLKPKGSMCAVGLNESDAKALIKDYVGVQIAAVNSPSSCTLSGDVNCIKQIVERLHKDKHFCRELKVDQAYHSHHMFPLGTEYVEKLTKARVTHLLENAKCAMYSSVFGRRLDASECTPLYWKLNMISTVKFQVALEDCIRGQPSASATLEIGPHPALTGPAQESLRTLSKSCLVYLPTCVRGQDDFKSLLASAGAMIGIGFPLQTSNINARELVDGLQCRHEPCDILTDTPSYQWNHTKGFWAESRISRNVRFREFPRHQLLGSRYVDDIPNRPSWRNRLLLKEIPWLHELKDQGLTEMPATAYLLMALEAARQLPSNRDLDHTSLCLSDLKIERPLPLSVFSVVETAIEVQLAARQIDAANKFAFEIFCQASAEVDSWIRYCSGILEKTDKIESPRLDIPNQTDDQALMNQAQTLDPSVGVALYDVKLESEGSSGKFKHRLEDLENYVVNPSILHSILMLPPMSLLGRKAPAEYSLCSITSLTVSTQPQHLSYGRFTTRVKPSGSCFVESDSEIHQLEKTMSLKGMRYRATKVIHPKPNLSPLFFKPVLLPDITRLSAAGPMDISRCAELLIHKWPLCDIKIFDVPERSTLATLKAFGAVNGEARLQFRSIKCFSIPTEFISDRVQLINNSDMGNKYHLIVANDTSTVPQLVDQLRSVGFCCIPKARMQHDANFSQGASVEVVCDITGLGVDPWVLLRKSRGPGTPWGSRRIVIFSNQHEGHSLNSLQEIESVALESAAVTRFCAQRGLARFDAIIIDSAEKPVITTWKGGELLPWLRLLLKSAAGVLWVTRNYNKKSSNVASSLLRTLQCEQPSLKISWLIVDEISEKGPDGFASLLKEAYVGMIEGEDELVRRAGCSEEAILRYSPDDCLDAYTGLSLPRKERSPLGGTDYSLEFAAPGEPVILSYKASGAQKLSEDTVEIRVETSVLDVDDLYMSNDEPSTEITRHSSGLFFTGRVTNSQDPEIPLNSHVVGWHPDHIHRNRVSARIDNVCRYPSSMQPSQAASKYACIAAASCIVDGVTRARRGETFVLDVKGPLVNAVKEICRRCGASVLDSRSKSTANFVITFECTLGVCVNGRPFDIASYLHSDHGRATVQQVWQELIDLPWDVHEYEINDYKEALKNTTQPWSTVLLHRNAAKILDHMPTYRGEKPMFTPHSNYIVVGGLGGLGRFICSWMIEHGARHITVISRSGARTQESRSAISSMNASGASIQCSKADACDRKAMSEILRELRSKRPIKGIINLAMVLGDAPMASMTAEEWDRVLRVKIDSSWILHEETLQDQLEVFILFSSIASVLGNRNQGNYNVANAALNALAEYRQSLDLPGISVALGAMTDMGVLYNLSNPNMLQMLSRSGLSHLTRHHLGKTMEGAILESPRRDRSLLVTGLNMFEREADGSLAGRTEPLLWTDWPEFGHLQQYKLPAIERENTTSKALLKDQVAVFRHDGDTEKMRDAIRNAFSAFLSRLLGFDADAFDPSQALMMYGIDSLSGVSCQYWFHRELEVDVSANEVLGGDSIENIVNKVLQQLTRGYDVIS